MAQKIFVIIMYSYLIAVSKFDRVQRNGIKISDWFTPSYELDGKDICFRLNRDPKVLILVASTPRKERKRNAIRYTWGFFGHTSYIAVAFVLGKSNSRVAKSVSREATLHNDLIVGNFIDSYYNMTLKTLTMLDWTEKFCPMAKFLLKIDEDMFLNPKILLEFTRSKLNATKTIFGNIVYFSMPIRSKNYTNYISAAEYPLPIFPPFASGPVYLMTADCLSRLKDTAMDFGYMRLEDVFVTGVIASNVSIDRVFQKEFMFPDASTDLCAPRRSIAVHKVPPKLMHTYWKRVMNDSLYCSPHIFHFTMFLKYVKLSDKQKLKLDDKYHNSFRYR